MDSHEHEELEELMGALRDGLIDDAQMQRLEALMARDPGARRYYVQFMELCADLRRYYGTGAIVNPVEDAEGEGTAFAPGAAELYPQHPRQTRGRGSYWAGGLALAAGIAMVASVLTTYLTPPPAPPLGTLAEAGGVAVLTRAADAVWERGSAPAALGAAIGPGRLRLASGLAQVEFYSGATVVLEGPADLEIVSGSRGVVHRGKVRTHVPPQARGFTLVSGGVDVVDLGTEFALSRDADGRTEVHVFEGEVRLKDRKGEKALTTGQAIRLTGGVGQRIVADNGAFVTPARLLGFSDQTLQRRRSQWEDASLRLAQDPGVILYYNFERQQAWERVVRDQKGGGVGAIVGAQWSEGRWPGKGALEFKRASDRIRINVPGRHEAMTLAAWVRFDGFDRWLSALMLTDGWEEGEPHWQVTWDGEIILGVSAGGGKGINYVSPKGVLGSADLGRWVHLVTVYDPRAQRVTHYVDGRAAPTVGTSVGGASTTGPLPPLSLGAAEIGNWSGYPDTRTTDKAVTRNLNGRIDEFIIMDRAMTAQEVQEMYESGRPQV